MFWCVASLWDSFASELSSGAIWGRAIGPSSGIQKLNSGQPTTSAALGQNVRCEGLSNPSLGGEVHTDEGFHWTYPISLSSVGLPTLAVLWRVLHCWARSLFILSLQMWHGPFDNHLEILGLCRRPTILPQGLCLRPTIPASSCSGLCLRLTICASSRVGLLSDAYHPCMTLLWAFCLRHTIHASSCSGPLSEACYLCII